MEEKIEIPLSKTKIFWQLAGAVIAVLLSVQLVLYPQYWGATSLGMSVFLRGLGMLSLIFCGAGGLFMLQKLLDNKAGLIIDERGIVNNTHGADLGLIEWADITRIDKMEVARTKFFMLRTNRPTKYIKRAKSGFQKRSLRITYQMYGSPLSIISASLKIRFVDLENLLQREFQRRKKQQEP
ncbi:MAG: STM3941 family protein [Bacteroidota bacterium]